MKALKFLLVCLSVGSIVFSCKEYKGHDRDVKETKTLTITLPEQVRENVIAIVREITPAEEEKDAMYRFLALYWSNLDYDGKKVTYKLNKDEFLSNKLSRDGFLSNDFQESDYDAVMSGVDRTNNFTLLDEDLRKCFAEQFPNAKKQWQEVENEIEKHGVMFVLLDEELRKCFDKQFPDVRKQWQKETEKLGRKYE
ncbi:MAG: hypothetical protein LBQ70_00150 [Prevotellaceae bacterium]|nr:hypothetical protein [Prevotellaceae bacterium]